MGPPLGSWPRTPKLLRMALPRDKVLNFYFEDIKWVRLDGNKTSTVQKKFQLHVPKVNAGS